MVLRWIGRGFLAAGTLILLFIVFQLYGTGFFTQRYQNNAKREFQASVKKAESGAATPTPGVSPTPGFPAALPDGAVALITIPKINLNMVVVQGVSTADLEKGPGHYPGTPMPGQAGNVVISGHRTTYLHPFRNIDQLNVGDPIYLTTLAGVRSTYLVSKSFSVLPTDISVIDNTPNPQLTLTTCTPPYSASHRLIVVAQLQGAPAQAAAA